MGCFRAHISAKLLISGERFRGADCALRSEARCQCAETGEIPTNLKSAPPMAADKSDAAGSFLANPNALLALVTIAGGLWLVSNKLTSDRPVTPAGGAKGFVADQNVEARLWEDPFKKVDASDNGAPPKLSKATGTIETLVEQVAWRAGRGAGESSNPAALRATDGVILLPVMLSGGQYSEDREARIRSRFAIISALGRCGYAPDDAEHIGVATILWPTQRQLAMAMNVEPGRTKLTRLWGEPGAAEKGKFFARSSRKVYRPWTCATNGIVDAISPRDRRRNQGRPRCWCSG